MMKLEEEEINTNNVHKTNEKNNDNEVMNKIEVENETNKYDSSHRSNFENNSQVDFLNKSSKVIQFDKNFVLTTNDKNYTTNFEVDKKDEGEGKKGGIPPSLKKTFISSIGLLITGILLIAIGFLFSAYEHSFSQGITFWILGFIVFIPGSYFSYKFYCLYKTKDEYERNSIIDQIPEL